MKSLGVPMVAGIVLGVYGWFGFEAAVFISLILIGRLLTILLEDIQRILAEARWL